jgi:3-oxoadipate enol-lactonase
MASKHMNRVTLGDGTGLAYAWDGPEQAPVLMLSNSLGTDHRMWDPQIAGLAAHFRVLRYDQRGHGASDAPAGAYAMDRLGRDAIELLDALGLDRVHFCGLSLGGMTGQWLALRAPDRIGRLILANTSAYMGPPSGWQGRIAGVLAQGMAPLAEASIARWFTPGFADRAPGAIAPIRAMLLANDPAGYAGCCAAIRDMDQRPTAALNRLPTLVIAGARDPATSVDDADFLARSAGRGRLHVLDDAAHLSNVEQPAAFLDAVLDFLCS